MSRPIDADKLKQYFIDKVKDFTYKTIHVDDVVACIDAMPTVEAKRGEWVNVEDEYDANYWRCSNCGKDVVLLEEMNPIDDSELFFCPNCGADMRADRKE